MGTSSDPSQSQTQDPSTTPSGQPLILARNTISIPNEVVNKVRQDNAPREPEIIPPPATTTQVAIAPTTTAPAAAVNVASIQPTVKITNRQEAEAYINQLAKDGLITPASQKILLQKAAVINKQEDWDNLALVGATAATTKRPDALQKLLENADYGGMARIAQASRYGADFMKSMFEEIDKGHFRMEKLPGLIAKLNEIEKTQGLEAAKKKAVEFLAAVQKAQNADKIEQLLQSGGVSAVVSQMGTSGATPAQVFGGSYSNGGPPGAIAGQYSGGGNPSAFGVNNSPSSLSTIDLIIANPSIAPPGSIATLMKNLDTCLQVLSTAVQEEKKKKDGDNTLDPSKPGNWTAFVSEDVKKELEQLVPGAAGLPMNEVIGRLTMVGNNLGNDAAQIVRELQEKRNEVATKAKELLELVRDKYQKKEAAPILTT